MSTSKSPIDILKLFKCILKEASEMYGRPAHSVSKIQFRIAADGRLGDIALMRCGGFVPLRNYVAPKGKKQPNKILERLLNVK